MTPEEDLERAVAEALRHAPELRTAEVAVHIEGTVVVLDGSVDDVIAAAAAHRIACAVPGVTHIDDRIQVRPDIGAEAAPKETEFGDASRANAATGGRG
jgi:osmotically-inducible protein OsmY